MKTKHAFPKTIDDLLSHPKWDGFIGSKLGNDLFINDPERAERIHDHAESGSDGSTHAERMEDWREFALDLWRSLSMDEAKAERKNYLALMDAINGCEEWHDHVGSLHEVIG